MDFVGAPCSPSILSRNFSTGSQMIGQASSLRERVSQTAVGTISLSTLCVQNRSVSELCFIIKHSRGAGQTARKDDIPSGDLAMDSERSAPEDPDKWSRSGFRLLEEILNLLLPCIMLGAANAPDTLESHQMLLAIDDIDQD